MEIQGFDWDEGNREKCQNHGLSPAEIESVFINEPFIKVNTNHTSDEKRFHAVGMMEENRYVFIVFTFRKGQGGTLIRPISAGYIHQKEIDHYEKQTKA